jgi:polysaccharide biosynthesis transport protein
MAGILLTVRPDPIPAARPAGANGRAVTVAGARLWTRLGLAVVPLCLVAGAAAGTFVTSTQPTEYRAEAMVLLTVQGGSVTELTTGGVVSQSQVSFYSDLVTTPMVLAPVIQRLGLGLTPEALAGRMDVQSESNTVVVRIGVRDASGPEAARVAAAVAERFQAAVATLAPKRGDGRPPVAVELVSRGTVPFVRVSPRPRANLGLGLVVGLVAGLGLLVLVRRVARPVSSRDLVARVTDAPVLGAILDNPAGDRRTIDVRSRLPRPEAFRMLRTTLRLRRPDDDDLCLVVTSSVRREGRTHATVDLAVAMAHTGRRVLVVDADLDAHGLTDLLRMDGSTGLAQVLAGEATVAETVRTWRPPGPQGFGIDLLPAGAPVPGAAQLLASGAMDEVLTTVRELYDRVLIDAAPLLDAADAAVLAARTDGALLLVDSRRTRQRQLTEAVSRLELADATVVGVVLTRVVNPATGPFRRPAPEPSPVSAAS